MTTPTPEPAHGPVRPAGAPDHRQAPATASHAASGAPGDARDTTPRPATTRTITIPQTGDPSGHAVADGTFWHSGPQEGCTLPGCRPDDQPRDATPSVHACPPSGIGTTPCCGRTPFELPRGDQITLDPDAVTCNQTQPVPATTPPVPDPALQARVYRALRAVGEGDTDPGTGSDYGDQTAAVLAELAPELAHAAPAPGYCPHCGRGDLAPTADQWAAATARAEEAEAALARARVAAARDLPLARFEHRDEPSDEERGWAAAMAAIEDALTPPTPAEEPTP